VYANLDVLVPPQAIGESSHPLRLQICTHLLAQENLENALLLAYPTKTKAEIWERKNNQDHYHYR
jgi:hypothetical protein